MELSSGAAASVSGGDSASPPGTGTDDVPPVGRGATISLLPPATLLVVGDFLDTSAPLSTSTCSAAEDTKKPAATIIGKEAAPASVGEKDGVGKSPKIPVEVASPETQNGGLELESVEFIVDSRETPRVRGLGGRKATETEDRRSNGSCVTMQASTVSFGGSNVVEFVAMDRIRSDGSTSSAAAFSTERSVAAASSERSVAATSSGGRSVTFSKMIDARFFDQKPYSREELGALAEESGNLVDSEAFFAREGEVCRMWTDFLTDDSDEIRVGSRWSAGESAGYVVTK